MGNNTTTWLVVGGLGVVVMAVLLTKSGSSSTQSSTIPSTVSGVTSNVGTPLINDSLLGFSDPTTGINWILNLNNQWVGTIPSGSLPPNFTPGSATVNPFFIPTTNTVTGTGA